MAYSIEAHSRLGLFLLSAAAAMAAEDLRQNADRHFRRDAEDLVALGREVHRKKSHGATYFRLRRNGQPCPALISAITEVLAPTPEGTERLFHGPRHSPIAIPITVTLIPEDPP